MKTRSKKADDLLRFAKGETPANETVKVVLLAKGEPEPKARPGEFLIIVRVKETPDRPPETRPPPKEPEPEPEQPTDRPQQARPISPAIEAYNQWQIRKRKMTF